MRYDEMLSTLFGIDICCVMRIQNVVSISCMMLLKMCQNMKMGRIFKMD
jgi:hypothetical protein